jgi:hypothetical protein
MFIKSIPCEIELTSAFAPSPNNNTQGLAVLFVTNFAACTFYWLARLEEFGENTWLGPMVADLSGIERYIISLYWSVVTFSTVSFRFRCLSFVFTVFFHSQALSYIHFIPVLKYVTLLSSQTFSTCT